MRRLFVVASLLTFPVIAAEFRGTTFGGSCSAVDEREAALGSNRGPWIRHGPDFYMFMGREFEHDVHITYMCKDGMLKLGEYQFPKRKYDDSVGNFIAAYSFYSSAYGSPFTVYAKPGVSPVWPHVGAPSPTDYHASWRAEGHWVHVDLMLRGNREGANWEVVVIDGEDTK